MQDFPDIGRAEEVVDVRGTPVTFAGIEIDDAWRLYQRYPELWPALRRPGSAGELVAGLSRPAVNDIIAAGLGRLGDEKTTARVANLSLGEKVEIVSVLMRLTMPAGPVRFMQALTAAMAAGSAASPPASGKQPRKPSTSSSASTATPSTP